VNPDAPCHCRKKAPVFIASSATPTALVSVHGPRPRPRGGPPSWFRWRRGSRCPPTRTAVVVQAAEMFQVSGAVGRAFV